MIPMASLCIRPRTFHVPFLAFLLCTGKGALADDWDIGQQTPLAEVCLLPDPMRGNTCAALFLDEDGFEICLTDEMAGVTRCLSLYRSEYDDGAPPEGDLQRPGLLGLIAAVPSAERRDELAGLLKPQLGANGRRPSR